MNRRTTQEYLLMSISAVTALGIFPFAIYRFYSGEIITGIFDLVVILSLVGVFSLVFFTKKVESASNILVFITFIGVSLIVYMRGTSHLYWLFPSIIAYFYLFPIVKAITISICASLITIAFVFPQINLETLSILLVTLSIICAFSFAFAKKMNIQNLRLAENSRIAELRNKTLELMVSSKSIADILELITVNVEYEYPDMMCSILLLDDNQHLTVGAGPSLPKFFNKAVNGIKIGDGVGSCGTAAFKAERIIVEDIDTHPYWQEFKELAQQANLKACWSEPIKSSQGEVLGTFAIYHQEISSPTVNDIKLIEQFAYLVSIAIEREKTNKLIWKQANFDNLTSLPNRNMMTEHLKQAMKLSYREGTKVAIAFLDLDHFKDINDTLGHAVGDQLLIEVANRISSSVRKNDTVARLGGDEFVIILPDFDDVEAVAKISETLLNTLSKPYQLNDQIVYTSASIGITVFPDDALDINSLLNNADQAMYFAKNGGRNSCYFFTEKMRALAANRIEIINDLRTAISQDEFFITYQPIINLNTNLIEKAEALIRWQHPNKGIINPLDFIPLAEESGLIIDISNWLLKEVVKQMKIWRTLDANFQVSINTSPIQYKKTDGNILQWLDYIKQESLDETAIALEITENLLMKSQSTVEETLKKVREHNIEVSIDDFGTGYSSFTYLREYQTDYLKIDKSFVQKMSSENSDAALCEAIIVMAKKLGMKVIAEGIETAEQESLLINYGCDYGQGYWFSKPVMVDDITELLIKNKEQK